MYRRCFSRQQCSATARATTSATGFLNGCIVNNKLPYSMRSSSFHHHHQAFLARQNQQEEENEEMRCRVHTLVKAFRSHGHIEATLDPLGLQIPKKGSAIELKPSVYNLEQHLDDTSLLHVDQLVHVGPRTKPQRQASLNEVLQTLQRVYCGNVAAQFTHLESSKEVLWLAKQLESTIDVTLTPEEQKLSNKQIQESEVFDHFLAKKFPGTKRYGLEGAESMIPAMHFLFNELSKDGVTDVVLGMPHRGRLNLLTGMLNFPPRAMFSKIKGNLEISDDLYSVGDVLSHLGISTTLDFGHKSPINVSLLNNPSHLEAINPVAVGKTRAKRLQGKNAACVLVHGDAAFCGQGIVPETFNMAKLPHFTVDGTVHIILNNQLGFTTPSLHYRSSRYSGDIGKMIGVPVLAVNAEALNDVVRVMRIAAAYRHQFKKDIIVELIAFRRHGHNELDSADFTQPKMYKTIKTRQMFPKIYSKQLEHTNTVSQSEIQQMRSDRENYLEEEFQLSAEYKPEKTLFNKDWATVEQAADLSKFPIPTTGVNIDLLKKIGLQSVKVPESLRVHERLRGFHIEKRIQAIENNEPVDWATAEAMAFGSLLIDGYNVRLSGQDVARGTFSQRHLEFVDQESEDRYTPLQHLDNKKGTFEVVTSPLSELAVLGFEYGYSINDPKNLVIWEAQFGDFWPSAQTVVDQFVACGEDKWGLSTGITMLLPHGMDGAGPEHSSSRIERFLQMCDSSIYELSNQGAPRRANMFVVNPTTPANYFHALRRQMIRKFRKPLVVISPKTLLKKKEATSRLAEMSNDTKFECVLPDSVDHSKSKSGPVRVMFCSGKIFYDLAEKRSALGLDQKIAIIRLEQLSPFPYEELRRELAKFNTTQVRDWMWVQEEHENQGAYLFAAPRLETLLQTNCKVTPDFSLKYVGREPAAVSAVGYKKLHEKELNKFMKEAFEGM